MKTGGGLSRREFLRCSTAAVAAMGVAAGERQCLAAQNPRTPGRKRRTKIRLGGRINSSWLQSPGDADLKFIKQLGLDHVDVTLEMVKGYRENGVFGKSDLKALIDRLGDVGLAIERANSLGPYYLNAHLGRAEGQREIDNLKRIGTLLAEFNVPIFGIQACQASVMADANRGGWSVKTGRGGYRYPAFDLQQAEAKDYRPKVRATPEQLWSGLLNIYRQVLPEIEGSKTRVAMHGNDPPLYRLYGNPQILCRFADFDRLFREAPSDHSGITFCVGTRYESGENIFEGIKHFGSQQKLWHVHFRNVRGTLPKSRGYEEVFMDDGDLDMAAVVRALDAVGYEGVIDYDHIMSITGDGPLPKQYIAFSIGYMRGLLRSL